MYQKNIKYAIRNLLRDKFYTLLNIGGLAVGITAALLLFMWVNNEYSYDNFHSKGERIFRINNKYTFGGVLRYSQRTALPLSEAAKNEIPEIEAISTVVGAYGVYKVGNEIHPTKYGCKMVEPSFLDIFDINFTKGERTTAFNNPNSIILTESLANRLFGQTDVIGRSINIANKVDLIVTGIIEDYPKNSVVQIESLLPLKENVEKFRSEGSRYWGSNNFITYALLGPDADKAQVAKKLTALIPASLQAASEAPSNLILQSIKDIYLGSNEDNVPSLADPNNIRLLGLLGFLLLLIACINYVNLTTARAAQRGKTVGIQKIIGATKWQLFRQHLIEAVIVVLMASLVGIASADLILPAFENLVNKKFPTQGILTAQTGPILIGVILIAIVLSGIQPALQIAAFKPINVLKGNTFIGKSGKHGLRRLLVVGQFTCSAILIICTLIMGQQLDYLRNSKLGFEKEHIFRFYQDSDKSQLIKNELIGKAGVESVVSSNRDLVNINSMYGNGYTYEGQLEGVTPPAIYNIVADSEFKDFFKLELSEGRWFRKDGKDSKSYIINETAAKTFNMENPIGKWVDLFGRKGTIVGVLKDFHFKSLHQKIEPVIFEQNPSWYDHTFVKTNGDNASEAIAAAKVVYLKHHPNSIFEYEFMDDTYNNLYKTETRIGKLFSLFSLLTIFISCLGIFGLATYTAERRGKEIGIRKVLGASVVSIVNLLSIDFLKLVLIALVIATPIAWYFMNGWLQEFAFSIKMSWLVFAGTAFLTILLAYFTIGFQSLRAALTNPSETLKTE